MERFELEEIVGQSNFGVVYRALDKTSKEAVAIHRFFPFEQYGGGLDKAGRTDFLKTLNRLTNAKHPALRSVITGGTDPIDHIPYIVTEWVEGISLQTLLADETLEPGVVMDILRLALESSIAISETLGDEALWVKTSVESIVVGDGESDRGFTFCISPLKWLGVQSEGKNLLPLVKLGENLIGWEDSLVSDRSGHGLAGWFKQLKHHPDTSLREALDSLNQLSEIAPQEDDRSAVPPAIPPALSPVAVPDKGAPKTILAAVALLAVSVPAALLFHSHRTASVPAVELGYLEQGITRAVAESDVKAASSSLEASPTLADRRKSKIVSKSARSLADPEPDATQTEPLRTGLTGHSPGKQAIVATAENHPEPPPFLFEMKNTKGAFEPVEEAAVKRLITGLQVKLSGELSEVKMVNSTGSIFLSFSSAEGVEPIRGVIRGKDFAGEFSPEVFEKYRGQIITLHGRIMSMGSGEFPLVKVVSMSDMTVGN